MTPTMKAYKILEDEPVFTPAEVGGFTAAAVGVDVRQTGDRQRLDLALLVSDQPCTVAGVFTRNSLAAAPVQLGRAQLSKGTTAKAVLVNSGNANAATGESGYTDALRMQQDCATLLEVAPHEVYVASTGRIGRHLPMDAIGKGLPELVTALAPDYESGMRAAEAILTSDTRRKVASVAIDTPSGPVRLSGMAKGAGMIEPNMATMLAFIVTDAAVAREDLQTLLQEAVQGSFNAITVDGDQSTNDTVLVLANGESTVAFSPDHPDAWTVFKKAMKRVCQQLAQLIVGDGEKVTKVVELRVTGASSVEEAEQAARAVGNSLLVKSSWYGNDPNWGRVLDAVGYSGARTREDSFSISYMDTEGSEGVPAFAKGRVFEEHLSKWKQIVAQPRFVIGIELGEGPGAYTLWSTDLTEDYVDFNKSE
jgi:glutamate N-acetyltransferase/amino-acid N-acetyltransferase